MAGEGGCCRGAVGSRWGYGGGAAEGYWLAARLVVHLPHLLHLPGCGRRCWLPVAGCGGSDGGGRVVVAGESCGECTCLCHRTAFPRLYQIEVLVDTDMGASGPQQMGQMTEISLLILSKPMQG